MKTKLSHPLKWHGGKAYLAKRIVQMMPPHLVYCEPFAGGLSVLLAKNPEGVSEVVNDIDKHIANFWQVIRHPHTFEAFKRVVEGTPFGEQEWRTAAALMRDMGWHGVNPEVPPVPSATSAHVARASWFFVAVRQSLAGRKKSFTGITKTRTRRGMNNEVSAWLTAIEGLPAVHARLKRVLILNRDALDVIRGQDGPETLFYLDPPYVHETRTTTADYAHEMNEDQHRELLHTLAGIKGRFLLSGYASPLYDSFETTHKWHRRDFDLPNNAASGKSKKRMVESVWMNFKPGE